MGTYSAPGKGATPLGKLWVSAVRMGCRVRSPLLMADGFPGADGRATGQSGPLMADELSWKAMMLLFAAPFEEREVKKGRGGEGSVRRKDPNRNVFMLQNRIQTGNKTNGTEP